MSDFDELDPLLYLMLQDDEEGLSGSERRRLTTLRKTLEQRYGGAQRFTAERHRWDSGKGPSDPEYNELCLLESKAGERNR